MMKRICYKEFISMIGAMNINDTFDVYVNYNEKCDDASDVYGVAQLLMFDSIMIVINYYGGGNPYIIDYSYSDYTIHHRNFEAYFNDISHGTQYVFVNESVYNAYLLGKADDPKFSIMIEL